MKHRSPKRQQSGFALLSVSLGLILFSAAMLYYFAEKAKADDQSRAENQVEVLDKIRRAGNLLILENYVDFQAGRDITRNGVVLPFGNAQGQALQPTVANLSTLSLGVENISDVPSYKSLSDGGYQLNISRSPAGCEATNLGANCRVSGLACFTQALRDPRKPDQDVDDFAIGRMLLKMGVDSGVSFASTPNEITGQNAAWAEPNPVGGQGIVCARFGWGSQLFTTDLHIRDQRDPEFQNNVTIAGGINVQRNDAVLGDACLVGEDGLAVWGEVAGNPVWLRCTAGVWEPGNGITYATAGDVCTQEGEFAMSATNIALVCSNGHWVSQDQKGLQTAAYYIHGSTVPVPACSAGLTATAVIAAVSASNIIGLNNAGNNTGSFQASINPSFYVTITGSDGSPAGNSASALVLTFCNPT